MKPEHSRSYLKVLIFYILFGIAITFAATILIIGIYQEIFQLIPMSLLLGVFIWIAFNMFSDRVAKETSGAKKPPVQRESPENGEKGEERVAPTDQK